MYQTKTTIISALKALPPAYNSYSGNIEYGDDTSVTILVNTGIQLIYTKPPRIDKSIDLLEDAIKEISERELTKKNARLLAMSYYYLSKAYRKLTHFSASYRLASEAVEIANQHAFEDLKCHGIAENYINLVKILDGYDTPFQPNISSLETKFYLPLTPTPEVAGTLKNLRLKLPEIGYNLENARVEPEALNVAQGEVGFSNKQLIGTSNVHNCVAVLMWNPITKRTAVAHIDNVVREQSMNILMEGMTAGLTDNARLQVKIIGARKHGAHTLMRVNEFFYGRHVEYVAAQIDQHDQPSSLVVNPENFEVHEALPGITHPNFYISEAAISIEDGRRLRMAFDLQNGISCAPIFYSTSMIDALYKEMDKNTTELELAKKLCGRVQPKNSLAVVVHCHFQAFEALEAECTRLFSFLNSVCVKLNIGEDIRHQAETAIRIYGKHIGHGAEIANRRLVEIISQELFSENEGRVEMHEIALKKWSDSVSADFESESLSKSSIVLMRK